MSNFNYPKVLNKENMLYRAPNYWDIHPVELTIAKHFNILHRMHVIHFDHDVTLLKNVFAPYSHYKIKDRYLILDHDTHHYLPGARYALTWYNIINYFIELDVPLWTMIILSNSTTLEFELKQIVPESLQKFMPTVIDLKIALTGGICEELTNKTINLNKDHELSIESIERHGISMMGLRRTHRNMLYHLLKERNLLDKIAVSYNNV